MGQIPLNSPREELGKLLEKGMGPAPQEGGHLPRGQGGSQMGRWHEEDGKGEKNSNHERRRDSARRRKVVRWVAPPAAPRKSWPVARQPPERLRRCPHPDRRRHTAHPPPLAPHVVGSTLGLPTQIFLFPWTKVVIDLKKKKGKEKRKERERDEVSRGPEPSLVLGTFNLGKELREGRGMGEKKKKRNNEKPNVRLKRGSGASLLHLRGLRAPNGEEGDKAKRGWWWRRLVVTFNFPGVGGTTKQQKNQKTKNKKTKNEKKTAIRHEDGMAAPPCPLPPQPAPRPVPHLLPLPPPQGPGPRAQAGSSGQGGLWGAGWCD
ncbi:histone-lysine N-methyltransferase 2B-like [Pteropus medius]|uniref:histone-lysine N-methyltransferase 2B-like n=1 Tax=Pteropus vampyrus TaxID=132908 RepID=UPI00196ABE74|nr:histone-lysine N-methyltransferase 2B-like [Pteropus giganteus]